MKLNQKKPELFIFNDDEYRKRAQNMTPDALWQRELVKYRAKVSSGCGVAFSGLMFVPTLGVSTVGLWVSGRTLDIARRKTHIVEAEVERRNLPHYDRKLRDTFIPLGISLAVITTIGVIDYLCLTGTSAAVLNSYAPHGLEALSAAVHNPHAFASAFVHGFQFQGQQFFHVGSQNLGLGLHQFQTTVNGNGFHHCFQSVADNVSIPGQDLGAASGLTGLKATAVSALQENAAAQGSQHAMHAVVAEHNIFLAACEGDAPALAGANAGMSIAAAAETHAAQFLIANTGGQNVFQSMTTEKSPTAALPELGNETFQLNQSTNTEDSQEFENLSSQALTGDVSRIFVFMGWKGLPISQRIMTPPTSQKCQHFNDKGPAPTCRFCCMEIDRASQAYYHCCLCSPFVGSYDICEVCVAGRGCSCSSRNEHVLYRKGFLSAEVEKGDLETLKPPKLFRRKKQQQIHGEEATPIDSVKARWRWPLSKSRNPPNAEILSDAEDNLPGLVEDNSDIESIYLEDEKALLIGETASFFSIEESEGAGKEKWNPWIPRSWWRKEWKGPTVPGVNILI